jgi:chemotaxis protein MotB
VAGKGGGGGGGGGKGVVVIVKKGKGHGGHHGGAWKVAYADFVTAMMALFLVLWLVSQTDEQMKRDIASYFRTGVFTGAPSIVGAGAGILEAASLDVQGNSMGSDDDLLEGSAKELKKALSSAEFAGLAGHVQIELTKEGLLIQIVDGGDALLFDLSSSAMKPELTEFLKRLGPILSRIPNGIQVHGHTDARPFPKGSKQDNWKLSFERADAARALLESSGMRKGQALGVFAHGSMSPLDKDPFSPRNRRLAILAVRRGLEEISSRGLSADESKKMFRHPANKALDEPAKPSK